MAIYKGHFVAYGLLIDEILIDVIDYSWMTHRLLIDYYTAHERHISCFAMPFFSFMIRLSVLDVFFFITGVPVDEITPSQKANTFRHVET